MSSGLAETAAAVESVRQARPRVPRRLLVTVRSGEALRDTGRLYRQVGFLTCVEGGFEFAYIQGAEDLGVRPLLGFADLHRRYRSRDLFPLFAERIMSAKRPDRAHYLQALDLDEDSEPWEILVRSGGRRAGDTIEVVPEPAVEADGRTTCTFLVHGVQYKSPEASDAISALVSGDHLQLRTEPENPVNSRAVLVLDGQDLQLGYVPNPLVEYVQLVMEHSEPRVTVVRANGPEVGAHLRLLVRVDGRVDVARAQELWPIEAGAETAAAARGLGATTVHAPR